MTIQTVLPFDRDSIIELSTSKHEPTWMLNQRLEALEMASELDLPKLEKTRIDRWNLDSYGRNIAMPAIRSVSDLPAEIKTQLEAEDMNGNVLVQHNSNVIFSHISDDLAAQGVIFTDLETALHKHPDLVQKYFMKAVKPDENKLTALHTALWNGGVFLYVPKNVEVKVPIHAIFVTNDAEASFSPHVLIIAEDNSRVTYVDYYVSGKMANQLVHNGIAEVFVNRGAHVQFASVHSLEDQITDLNYRRANVSADGKMEWIVGEMNDGNVMSDTSSILLGNGAVSHCKVICVGTNDQKLNITTRATHWGKNTFSDMATRAVMRDNSVGIFNGVTKIEKGATFSNGEQVEKVLMLSPGARGDANPMLLIDEDEVKAYHAASVGQVNKEQVYYLMSRGISEEDAHKLIIYGFLAEVVTQMPIAKLEEQLKRLVERKLGQ